VDGLGGLIHEFFFFFCFLIDLPRRASNLLGKYPIYHDLCAEAVVMPVLIKIVVVVYLN
jgi:hypothetical protein